MISCKNIIYSVLCYYFFHFFQQKYDIFYYL